MAHATPEQAKAGMDAWMAWSKHAGHAIVDMGSPLKPVTTIGQGAEGHGHSHGHLGGFSILQAESSQGIGGLLKNHPHLMAPGASIEVHEFLPMPGM